MVPTDRVGQDQAGAIHRAQGPVCDPATLDIEGVGHSASTMAQNRVHQGARLADVAFHFSEVGRHRLCVHLQGGNGSGGGLDGGTGRLECGGHGPPLCVPTPDTPLQAPGAGRDDDGCRPAAHLGRGQRSHRVDRVLLTRNAHELPGSGAHLPEVREQHEIARDLGHVTRQRWLPAPLAPPRENGRRAMETADWPDRATQPARRRHRCPGPLACCGYRPHHRVGWAVGHVGAATGPGA